MVTICGGSGGSKGGGGGSGGGLSDSEIRSIEKNTVGMFKNAEQATIKRYAAATEAQIKSITPGYLSASPDNLRNYQRMVTEYNAARRLIK